MQGTGGRGGWRLGRYLGDAASALVAWYGAVWLRVHVPLPLTIGLLPRDRLALVYPVPLLVVALQLLTLYFLGFYYSREPRPRLELAVRLLIAVGTQGLVLTAYFFLADHTFPRSVLLLYVAADWLLLLSWRALAQRLDVPPQRRVALVGNGAAAVELAFKIGQHHWHGLHVVGHLREPGGGETSAGVLGPCLGAVEEAAALLRAGAFDDLVIVAQSDTWQSRLVDQLAGSRPVHTSVLMLPGPLESLIGRMRYRWVSDLPLIEVMGAGEWRRPTRPWKRLEDLLGAGILLLLASPAMLVCALLVRITSPGPVLYRQTRVGRWQEPFTLLKLRTMRLDAERDEEVLATPGDPRLTPIGALLRRLRLDELPQLLNVLGGSMSLVGPRPERPGFVRTYLGRVPGYAERFTLRPGLTGLAQVSGEYDSTAENKLRYDLAYTANASLWLDLSILVRTIRTVLSTRGV